jgi:hypothetical protein
LAFRATEAFAYAGQGLLEAHAPKAKIPINNAAVANFFMMSYL